MSRDLVQCKLDQDVCDLQLRLPFGPVLELILGAPHPVYL